MIDLEGLNNLQESLALDLSHQIVLCFNVLVTIVHKLVTGKKKGGKKERKKEERRIKLWSMFSELVLFRIITEAQGPLAYIFFEEED